MDERRLRKFFHFTEADLSANRRGQFSEGQKNRLKQQAKAERASARSSAIILFVVAAAGLAIGLTVGSIAPSGLGRILIYLFMGVVWAPAWAGRAVKILLAARKLQEPRLRHTSGPVHILRHGEAGYVLHVGGQDFDVDGNPSGVIIEDDGYTIHYLEETEEILSVEPLMRGK